MKICRIAMLKALFLVPLIGLPRPISLCGQRQFEYEPTPEELPYLPDFCAVRTLHRNDTKYADVRKWQAYFGSDWVHLHHFCGALAETLRGQRAIADPVLRRRQFKSALNNYDYVLEHATASFSLRPLIHVKKGGLYVMLDLDTEAAKEYAAAIKANPTLELPYLLLSELFVKSNDHKSAVDILKAGLQHCPGSQALEDALAEIVRP